MPGVAALAVVAIAAAPLVGCRADIPMPVPTPTYTSSYVAPEPLGLAPLTGETVPLGSFTHPSVAAKIDNHPDARPQFGLERADIVYEELVEGGLSRYVAIWHSDIPDEIGPVRSIRPMDPDIASPTGGLIAYAGGQARFIDMMVDTPVRNIIFGYGDTEDLFYRTDVRDGPHDVLLRAPIAVSRSLDLAAPGQQFAYAADVAAATATKEGEPTGGIQLEIGGAATPSWTWDAASSTWLRFQTGGAPDASAAGPQLSASNVVVLRVGVTWGYDVPKTELAGLSGEAWVSTGAATVHGLWVKHSRDGRINLVDDAGIAIRLAPGTTWVELVPNEGSVAFTPPAA